jgi:hypothetical protein
METKTILGGALILGTIITTTIVYKSITITEEAKNLVVTQSLEWGMSQRDTASKMIIEYANRDKIRWDPQALAPGNVQIIRMKETTPGNWDVDGIVVENYPNTGEFPQ